MDQASIDELFFSNGFLFEASSWHWILLYFAIAIIAFHYLSRLPYFDNEMAWKKIEYLWLFFAGVAVLGIGAEVQKIMAQADRNKIGIIWQNNVDHIEDRQTDVRNIVCSRKFVRSEFSPENFDEVVSDFQAYCEFLTSNPIILNEVGGENDLLQHVKIRDFIVAHPSLNELETADFFDNYFNELQSLKDKELHLKDYQNDIVRNFWRMLLPLILPLIIALRVTKATVEIRRLEKK